MEILSVSDAAFAPYGKVLSGYDFTDLTAEMLNIPHPVQGTAYLPSIASLEACQVFEELQANAYGGLPIELGMCWGHNQKLNCLEYHRTSEINIGAHSFILLVAMQQQIENGELDTSSVKAFRVPEGVAVELYATTLHYAPCHDDEKTGFRTAVVLPRGTNEPLATCEIKSAEDRLLRACNKWLLAHPESPEALNGAYIGLRGKNLDISEDAGI